MGYRDFAKTFDLFKDLIKKNQFDLIGLGFMSHHWDIYVELTKVIHETLPNCKIIAGGVHAWHISESDTLKHCDYIYAGEGEELYSSGLGDVFPPNYLVGKIIFIEDKPDNEFLQIEVEFIDLPKDQDYFLVFTN